MTQRARSLIEVSVGIVLLFGYIWLIYPMYQLWIKIIIAVPILLFFIFTNTKPKELGFTLQHWKSSAKVLALFTIISIPLLYGIWQMYFPINTTFYADPNFWKRLMIYPIWALIQQYIVLGFFFRRYRYVFAPYSTLAIFFTALTFSMMHIPAPSLLVFTFIAGLVWATVYNKYSNLYTIAISHAILGAFVLQVLWMYGKVGPDARVGVWSKKQQPVVLGGISSVEPNIHRKGRLVEIGKDTKQIDVKGWLRIKASIENIQLHFGEHNYPVEYNTSSFHSTIPLDGISSGYYPLTLSVSLQDSFFNHSPTKPTWINIK